MEFLGLVPRDKEADFLGHTLAARHGVELQVFRVVIEAVHHLPMKQKYEEHDYE